LLSLSAGGKTHLVKEKTCRKTKRGNQERKGMLDKEEEGRDTSKKEIKI
jgi:hypothetical protein